MEEYTQLFNMVPEVEQWQGSHIKLSEDKKLELTLGPPGEFLGYKSMTNPHGAKRVLEDTFEAKKGEANWFTTTNEKQCKKFSSYDEKGFSSPRLNCSLHSSTFNRETQKELQHTKPSYIQCSDKEACTNPATASSPSNISAGTNNSHKRVAFAPVVGWPPIRSFRKNLQSSSTSKLAPKLPSATQKEGGSIKSESPINDLFVKINVEGVPIGRKINLSAYDSYDNLSVAIDELFRGLIAAQSETLASWRKNSENETKTNSSSVAANGEYTLIYEDNEGDRMLVGDVPWHMFVSTVKRLRVLKSSELSTPRSPIGGTEQEKTPLSS